MKTTSGILRSVGNVVWGLTFAEASKAYHDEFNGLASVNLDTFIPQKARQPFCST